MITILTFIENTDLLLLNAIQKNLTCAVLDVIMPFISALGNSGAIWICAGIALLFTKKYRKYGILLLIGLAAGFIVGNVILKNVVARPRPCRIDDSVRLLIKDPTDYSFPSGHTLSSVIGAVMLTLTNRRFGYVAAPLAFLIAVSRLYLYVHFPSDILAAVLLGIVIGKTVFTAGAKLVKKKSEQNAGNV